METPKGTTRAKHWCLTINNPTETDWPYPEDEDAERELEYAIIGNEVAPTTGTKHLQMYIVFKERKTFPTVKKLFPRAWIALAKGTPESNKKYCSKDGDFGEYGTLPEAQTAKATSASLERYRNAIEAAKTGDYDAIIEESPDLYVRFMSTWERIRVRNAAPVANADDVTGIWIHGPSGAGKSSYAQETWTPNILKAANKWWDDYHGEDYVIIDEIDPSHRVSSYYHKIWADRYPFMAETKGGSMRIRPKKIIFTSNFTIEQVYAGCQATIDSMKRRCQVIHIGVKGPLPDLVNGATAAATDAPAAAPSYPDPTPKRKYPFSDPDQDKIDDYVRNHANNNE